MAIVVLASALAADGALRAAPVKAAEMSAGSIAGRFVQRISVGLRRTIAAGQRLATRQVRGVATASQSAESMQPQVISPLVKLLLPSQLRLPPPLA
jgi:hypothetical protein